MCGIVAYIGLDEASDFLLDGLHRLEYRGYDSAGIATLTLDAEITVTKTAGRIDDLQVFSGELLTECRADTIASLQDALAADPASAPAARQLSAFMEMSLGDNAYMWELDRFSAVPIDQLYPGSVDSAAKQATQPGDGHIQVEGLNFDQKSTGDPGGTRWQLWVNGFISERIHCPSEGT